MGFTVPSFLSFEKADVTCVGLTKWLTDVHFPSTQICIDARFSPVAEGGDDFGASFARRICSNGFTVLAFLLFA